MNIKSTTGVKSISSNETVSAMAANLYSNQHATGSLDAASYEKVSGAILDATIRRFSVAGIAVKRSDSKSVFVKRDGIYYPGSANKDGTSTGVGKSFSKEMNIMINTSIDNGVEFSVSDIDSVQGASNELSRVLKGKQQGTEAFLDRFIMTKALQRASQANDFGYGTVVELGLTPDIADVVTEFKSAINTMSKYNNLQFSLANGVYSGDIRFPSRSKMTAFVVTDLYEALIEEAHSTADITIEQFGSFEIVRYKGVRIIEEQSLFSIPATFTTDGLPNEGALTVNSFLLVGEAERNFDFYVRDFDTYIGTGKNTSNRTITYKDDHDLNGEMLLPELIILGRNTGTIVKTDEVK